MSFNSEKIRQLYNKLQKSMFDFRELKYKNKHLHFQYYKNQIETLSLIAESTLQKLSLKLFRTMFEGPNEFQECSDDKVKDIDLLIKMIKGELPEDHIETIFSAILTHYVNEDFDLFYRLIICLQELRISSELIYIMLLYFFNQNNTLNSLLEMLIPILNGAFPGSYISFEKVLCSNISLKSFVENFCVLCENNNLDNYVDIIWDDKINNFVINKRSVDEITEIILSIKDEKAKKNKSKNKKKKINKEKIEDDKTVINTKKEEDDTQKKEKISLDNISFSLKNLHFDKVPGTSKNNNNEYESINNNKELKLSILSMKNIQNQEFNEKNYLNPPKQMYEKKKNYEESKGKMKKPGELNEKMKNNDELNEKMKKNYEDKCKAYEKTIKNLTERLAEKDELINELQFCFKMIGLKTAYHSFIDLLIYIFNLKDIGNLYTKVKSIKDAFKTNMNSKKKTIIDVLDIILDLIDDANYEAHYIDFNGNLIDQLIENLKIYVGDTKEKKYCDEAAQIINVFKAETQFKELVRLRTFKFRMEIDKFKEQENTIIDNIRKNPSIEEGKKALNKL